jgi:hypothetical protein
MAPPSLYVLDKQMHHEVVCRFFLVGTLQEETRVSMPEVCEIVKRPGKFEAQILIETFGQSEVLGWHVGL